MPAIIVAAGFALVLFTQAAPAACRQELLTCESRCPDARAHAKAVCAPRCRSLVICEAEPGPAASSSLPGSALPAGDLPPDRLPKSRLPDGFRN